jgi:N-methylhydantoinase B
MSDPTIPKNSGCFRPIKVVALPGTVVNVDYPGPSVAGNTETHPRLVGIVFGAMAQCVPERVMAAEGATGGNFVFGGVHPEYDEYYGCYDIMCGGWGGRDNSDGNDANCCINGNCRYNPTEVFETRFPWLVEDYTLVTDSAGPGRHRGGLGFRRTLRAEAPEITVSQCSDRHRIKPWGLEGGGEGGNGSTLFQRAGSTSWLTMVQAFNKASSSKFSNVTFRNGDRVRITVPGGGGFGLPKERDRKAIAEDILEGYITKEAAHRDYGY